MPYTWTEPDVALSHQGVDIYYLYLDDYADNPTREHWFGFDPSCSDEDGAGCFDLRDVAPLLPACVRQACGGDATRLLIALIDAGYLTADGLVIAGRLHTDAASIRAAVAAAGEEGAQCSPSP